MKEEVADGVDREVEQYLDNVGLEQGDDFADDQGGRFRVVRSFRGLS